jgi:hypothetical protein
LGGFGAHGDREHLAVDLADVDGSIARLVDALGGRSTDRSYRINRLWLAALRAVVPTPPSRRWTAWTVKRRIEGVPVEPAVREAVIEAIHANTRRPAGTRIAAVLPPVAKLVIRRFPETSSVHLDAAPLVPTFATQARVTTIGVPEPTELFSGIVSAPERRGILGERYPLPRLARLLPRLPHRWLRPAVTQVAVTTPAHRTPLGSSAPVAVTIDSTRCWHRAPASRTEAIRIKTTVLVPLPLHVREVSATLRRTGGVTTTRAGRRVIAWPAAK